MIVSANLTAVILGCAGPQLSADEKQLFQRANPVGFILFARNIETPQQVSALTQALRDTVGWRCPILIDQEGGRVARLAAPQWDEFPPALSMASGPDAQRGFWLRGRLIADQLYGLGINVNCAPVLDIAAPDTHPILQNRCYGHTVGQVVRNARAFASGQAAGGILGVAKHIPGHGRATLDSHLALPTVDVPVPDLIAHDFKPFYACRDLPFGMTAHIRFTAIDPQNPATLSPDVIAAIRSEIKFGGFLMTDDISMKALTMPLKLRVERALQAGCDTILHCNGDFNEMQSMLDYIPYLGVKAIDRLNIALSQSKIPAPVDIMALKEEFLAQKTGGVY